jgi:hypothetical protein
MIVSGLLLVVFSAGCASNGSNDKLAQSSKSTARDPSWTKYTVAGSRIPRQVDAQGQPMTGSQVVTITDEQLQNASGMLLGEKLGNGYSR